MTDMCVYGKGTCPYSKMDSNYCPLPGLQNGCYNWTDANVSSYLKDSKKSGLVAIVVNSK
jgi:hypothetical protein